MLSVDHVFVCCARSAPEARTLLELGLFEGSRNRHPGQGTANRRFFFSIVFRSDESPLPFATWSYKPRYLPAGTSIEFVRGVPITEPELALIASTSSDSPPGEPIEHRVPIRRISKLEVFLPTTEPLFRSFP